MRACFSSFLAQVDDTYIHESIRLIAEENGILVDPENSTMHFIMYMGRAAQQRRNERIEAFKKQQMAALLQQSRR